MCGVLFFFQYYFVKWLRGVVLFFHHYFVKWLCGVLFFFHHYFVEWMCGVLFFFDHYFVKWLCGRTASGKHNVKESITVLRAISRFELLHSLLQVTSVPKTFVNTKVEFVAFRPKFRSTHLNWIFCTNVFNNILNLDSEKIKHLRFILVSRIRSDQAHKLYQCLIRSKWRAIIHSVHRTSSICVFYSQSKRDFLIYPI